MTCIYWTSLTFLDPLAAVLLLVKPRVGLALALAIIISDVAHNTWRGWIVGWDWLNWMYLSQVAFLIFLSMTFKPAWRGVSGTHGSRGLPGAAGGRG